MKPLAVVISSVALMASALLVAAPAQAQGAHMDARDARFGIDMRGYDVFRKGRFYVVRVKGWEFTRKRLNVVQLNIDVNSRNRGPEYFWSNMFKRDRDGHFGQGLSRVDSWADPGRRVSCRRWYTRVNYASDLITIRARRGCIKTPKRVRMQVRTADITDYNHGPGRVWGYWDDAPRKNRFPALWVR